MEVKLRATSVGAIQLDLEVKSDIDEDIHQSTQKLASQIREQMKAYSSDLFKELRNGLSSSLDKVQETIENCLNKTKSEMQKFVEEMKAIAKSARFDIPIANSENPIKPMQSVSQMVKPIRGPPKVSLSTGDINSEIDSTNKKIEIQKQKLNDLRVQYENLGKSIAERNESKEYLDALRNQIDSINRELSSLNKKSIEIRLNNIDRIEYLKNQLNQATEESKRLEKQLSSKQSIGLESSMTSLNEKMLKLNTSIVKDEARVMSLKQKVSSLGNSRLTSLKKSIDQLYPTLGKVLSGLGKVGSGIKSMTSKAIQGCKAMANGFQNTWKAINKLGSGFGTVKNKISQFGNAIRGTHNQTNGYRQSLGSLVRTFTIFSLVFPLVSQGIRALGSYLLSTLKTNNQFVISLNQIRSNLQTAFTPIFNAILPAINALMSAIAKATAYLSAFISSIFGKSLCQTQKATSGIIGARDALESTGASAKKTAKAIKEATRSLMGFDEINNLNKNNADSGASGGGGTGGSIYTPSDIDTSTVSDFAKKLRDMWKKGDYSGIGKEIGLKINEAVQSFTDFISWDRIGGKISEFIYAFCDIFNSLVRTIDWESIGKMFATGINTLSNTLYKLLNLINWKMLGSALAQGVNGFVNYVDWERFGATIGSYFKAKIDALYGFVTTADWEGIGNALSTAVMGLVNKVDFATLGATFGNMLKGAISTSHNFINGIDWSGLGQKIGSTVTNFFSSVNWKDLGMTLSDAVKGIIKLFSETVMNTSWEDVGRSISDCILGIDWIGIILGLGDLLVRLILGLSLSIGKAFVDIAKAMWDGLTSGITEFFSDPGKFIKENIVDPFVNWIKSLFGIHSPSTVLHEIGVNVMQGLINGLKSMPIVGSIAGLIGDGINWIKNQYENFKTKGKELFDNVKKGIANNPIVQTVGSAINNGVAAIKNKASDFLSKGKDLMTNLKSGISNMKENVTSTVADVVSGISSKVSSAVSSAYSWGKDMMSGLSKGINSAKDTVINGVKGLASKISSFLHFSRPDEGPLRDYEKWMPDFMQGMRSGIERNKSSLLGSIKTISTELANSFNALQQPEIAFAGSQDVSVTHFVEEKDSKIDILRDMINDLNNRNNDDAQTIVTVLYELLDVLQQKELTVDADALNNSNRQKELQRKLRTGR